MGFLRIEGKGARRAVRYAAFATSASEAARRVLLVRSAIGRRAEVASENAPLLVLVGGGELGDLLHAVGHHDANTTDELIGILAAEGRQRHAAPQPGHCALAAQEY